MDVAPLTTRDELPDCVFGAIVPAFPVPVPVTPDDPEDELDDEELDVGAVIDTIVAVGDDNVLAPELVVEFPELAADEALNSDALLESVIVGRENPEAPREDVDTVNGVDVDL